MQNTNASLVSGGACSVVSPAALRRSRPPIALLLHGPHHVCSGACNPNRARHQRSTCALAPDPGLSQALLKPNQRDSIKPSNHQTIKPSNHVFRGNASRVSSTMTPPHNHVASRHNSTHATPAYLSNLFIYFLLSPTAPISRISYVAPSNESMCTQILSH